MSNKKKTLARPAFEYAIEMMKNPPKCRLYMHVT